MNDPEPPPDLVEMMQRPYTPLPVPPEEFQPPIHIRWLLWHRENPHFYPLFRRFALQLINAGRRRISAAAIFERIRWDSMIQTDGEPWKLNDQYRAYYARLFMVENPEWPDVFETRVVTFEPPVSFFLQALR